MVDLQHASPRCPSSRPNVILEASETWTRDVALRRWGLKRGIIERGGKGKLPRDTAHLSSASTIMWLDELIPEAAEQLRFGQQASLLQKMHYDTTIN